MPQWLSAVRDRRLEFLHLLMLEITAGNHPGAIAPPLLIQEGSSGRLPSSDEEGRRARGGGGAEQEMYELEAAVYDRRRALIEHRYSNL